MKNWGTIRSGVLLVGWFCAMASASERPIDLENSSVRIHVGTAGFFSAAGHKHWVTAPIAQGSLDEGESSHIAFTFDARKLMVEPDNDLSAEKQAEVQRTMQEKVLEREKYPKIGFRSTSVEKTGNEMWTVTGILNLHGYSNPVRATVHRAHDKYVGRCRIKQTDFGIQPVTVGGGLVKVKNELDIDFTVIAAHPGVPGTPDSGVLGWRRPAAD
jgi:polyisoprenoid-binding protein YceI